MQTHQQMNAGSMMTEEEYHSLIETYKFLSHIIDPQKTPRIAKPYREMARKCLEHFPTRRTLEELQCGVDFFNPR